MATSFVSSGPAMVKGKGKDTQFTDPRLSIVTALNWAFQVLEANGASSSTGPTTGKGATPSTARSSRSQPAQPVTITTKTVNDLVGGWGAHSAETIRYALTNSQDWVVWVLTRPQSLIDAWTAALQSTVQVFRETATVQGKRLVLLKDVPGEDSTQAAPMNLAPRPLPPAALTVREAAHTLMSASKEDLRTAALMDHERNFPFAVPL